MIKNYLKIAFRNIIRHKTYAAVNVLGLTLGICACLIIYLIVGYDTFHPGKNRIYRVMGDITESTGEKLRYARSPAVAAITGRPSLSGVEHIAAVIPYHARISIYDGQNPVKTFDSRVSELQYM